MLLFDYIDSARSGGIGIISFTSFIGIPAGLASARFTLIFPLATGIIKKLLKIRKRKKKHNKIVMLIDLDISHEECKTVANEKEKYEQMKEGIRNTKSRDELSENSKENSGNA